MEDLKKMKEALAEQIYILTATPKTYPQLCNLYPLTGTPGSLEDAFKRLSYYSFNDMVRHKCFPFLTIMIAKNESDKEFKAPYILYYWNKDIVAHPNYCPQLFASEKIDVDGVKLRDYDTIYFEPQNSLTFIEGRKQFVRLIDFCQKEDLTNGAGMVPLSKVTQGFSILYPNEEFSTKFKTWFPNCGGFEKTVQKILFEDVQYSLGDPAQKKESEFALKKGWTLKEMEEWIDDVKVKYEELKEKIERDLHAHTMARLKKIEAPPKKQLGAMPSCSTPKMRRATLIAPSSFGRIFGDSSDEEDQRAENRPYNLPQPPQYDGLNNSDPVANRQKEEEEKPGFLKKYNICPDKLDVEQLCADEDACGDIDGNGKAANGGVDGAHSNEKTPRFGDSDDDNDCFVTVKTAVKSSDKPKSKNMASAEKSSSTMPFYRPAADFKKYCEQLGLQYNLAVHKFWQQITIENLTSYCVPDNIYPAANNGFASLSLYFTGTPNNGTKIREALVKHFYTNMNELVQEYNIAKTDSKEYDTQIFSEEMNNLHVFILTKLLRCRVGIFEDGQWKRYGTWNPRVADILTLLMVLKNGLYSPILSLK